MILDPGYINLWIPFILVCVLALVVLTVLLVLIVQSLGGIHDELKRFNSNEEKLYPIHPPDKMDGDDWEVDDLFDQRV